MEKMKQDKMCQNNKCKKNKKLHLLHKGAMSRRNGSLGIAGFLLLIFYKITFDNI